MLSQHIVRATSNQLIAFAPWCLTLSCLVTIITVPKSHLLLSLYDRLLQFVLWCGPSSIRARVASQLLISKWKLLNIEKVWLTALNHGPLDYRSAFIRYRSWRLFFSNASDSTSNTIRSSNSFQLKISDCDATRARMQLESHHGY